MVGTTARINCLDASALVKLVVSEDRAEKLIGYLRMESGWFTTFFCFYEALNVLKSKYVKRKVTKREYYKASFDLMAEFNGGKHYLPDLDLTDVLTFAETQKLCEKYDLDVSDAFQILSVKGSPFIGDSRTVLVTDDEKLAAAARCEHCVVWYLPDDPPA